MNKADLKKAAAPYFKQYEKVQEVYTTGDGNFFLEGNKAAADTHAAQSKKRLWTVTREDEAKEEEPKPFSQMTKRELAAAAADLKVDISKASDNKSKAALLQSKLDELKGEDDPNKLSEMEAYELDALAKELGIELKGGEKPEEIFALIEAKQKAKK